MIDLNIKIARFKFKKLGEANYSLWIMLVKPIQRVNLTSAWMWNFLYELFYWFCFLTLNKFIYLHKCCMVVDQILHWAVWLSPIKIETCICIYYFFIELKNNNTKTYILQEYWNYKPRLNRYDFYVEGF